jgi:hypothetical protein
MIGQRAIVSALETFLDNGPYDATEGSPGGMVVDPGRRTRGPNEDLQRVAVLGIVVTMGHIPVFGLSRLLQEGQDA